MKAVVLRHLPRKWIRATREIYDLADAAAYEIVNEITFYGEHSQPKTFLPEMKLQDLQFLIEEENIDKILIDGSIHAKQMLALEEITDLEVMDKPMLVLEIFSNRANTADIQLQIQLAQLKYSVPRMVSKLGEAVQSERPGFGGTGEQVTEILVSDLKRRIRTLEAKLEGYRSKEDDSTDMTIPRLPLIGYYSAGKSTLFNILTSQNRETSEQAFTTMILKSARTKIAGYSLELIDTIGLVDLPSDILSAFDVMLHSIFSHKGMILCLDCSLPIEQWVMQLDDIGSYVDNFTAANDRKILIVFTKTDLVKSKALSIMKQAIEDSWITNHELVMSRIDEPEKTQQEFIAGFERLYASEIQSYTFHNVNPANASKIHDTTRVEEQEWLSDGNSHLSVIAPKSVISKLRGELG
ncbi:MAG: HflX-like GTP-binding protein [Candidatus Kariarchaeaceae archaeon]|jgi:GTP-binding protein HflX